MPRVRPLPDKRQPNRQRIPVTLSLPRELLKRIDAICAREQRPRSQILEWAALHYLATKEKAAA